MNNVKYKTGQSVWCYYHYSDDFTPPMCGKVLFKSPLRMKHHFSRLKDGKCSWYFVYMENGKTVLFPEPCLNDLKKEIDSFTHSYKPPIDLDQIEAWSNLNKWQVDRVRYYLENE